MPDQPHTPTTEQIRDGYSRKPPGHAVSKTRAQQAAEFDRWHSAEIAAAKAEALRDAAESHDVIDHMYKHFDNHPIQAPAAVRATATYLHDRADLLEGDDETH